MTKLAIFASGTGTNALRLIDYFNRDSSRIRVSLLVCNNPKAAVLEKAKDRSVKSVLFSNEEIQKGEKLIATLQAGSIEWIVLAGFLRKIPDSLIEQYKDRIINIHPSLLPKHGGKGMYGRRVHQAVIDAKESKSGISIHLVTAEYDQGAILFQKSCSVKPTDDAADLAQKIQLLEHKYFPEVVESTILKSIKE